MQNVNNQLAATPSRNGSVQDIQDEHPGPNTNDAHVHVPQSAQQPGGSEERQANNDDLVDDRKDTLQGDYDEQGNIQPLLVHEEDVQQNANDLSSEVVVQSADSFHEIHAEMNNEMRPRDQRSEARSPMLREYQFEARNYGVGTDEIEDLLGGTPGSRGKVMNKKPSKSKQPPRPPSP